MSTLTRSRTDEPKLLVPGLAGFYAIASELSWVIVRVAPAAILFFMHGWGKLMAGPTPVIGSMTRVGIYPPTLMGYIVIFLETAGAICVAIGLFTRFFAAALVIEMAIIALYVHASWGMSPNRLSYELTLTWGLIFLAVALRGGGPFSLDRKIGREL